MPRLVFRSLYLLAIVGLALLSLVACEVEDELSTDNSPPTVPGGLRVMDVTDASVDLSWEKSGDNIGTTGYLIYRNDMEIGKDSVNRYSVNGLTAETDYSFRIRAVDASGNISAFTPEVSAKTLEKQPETETEPKSEPEPETAPETVRDTIAPSMPQGLTVENVTKTTVDLSWEVVTDSLSEILYTVFQDSTLLDTLPDTEYQVTELEPGTEYRFSVTAVDSAQNASKGSEIVVVTTEQARDTVFVDTIPPTPPIDLIALDSTLTSITLRWSAATDSVGVTGYRIFRDSLVIDTVQNLEYTASGLDPGSMYSFAVSAIDSIGNESAPSKAISVSTLPEEAQAESTRILVFTKTLGFRHTSIAKGASTLTKLGEDNNFEVDQTENGADFNVNNLAQYQAVVFLNTTGDVLNAEQQAAFEDYIRQGGNFMGVHAASDTEYDWPWYGRLVGAYFNGHPAIQEAGIRVIRKDHPATSHLNDSWTRTDEWYNFRDIAPDIIPLLNLDETTYEGGTNGEEHHIAWYREFDGGRSFYTGGGHTEASYDEPDFRQHLLGGILYCLGR